MSDEKVYILFKAIYTLHTVKFQQGKNIAKCKLICFVLNSS